MRHREALGFSGQGKKSKVRNIRSCDTKRSMRQDEAKERQKVREDRKKQKRHKKRQRRHKKV